MAMTTVFLFAGYGSFLGPGLAGGYGYGYGGGFGGPVVQHSDGGSGFITILVVVAALFIASQVASNVFGNGDDGDSGESSVLLAQEQTLSVSTQPPVPIQACSALCTSLSAHSSTSCASGPDNCVSCVVRVLRWQV